MAAPSLTAPVFTFNVTDPEAPPPVNPVPALTFVISPTFVVYPKDVIRSLIAEADMRRASESSKVSPAIIKLPAAISDVVKPETFRVTVPEVPPPVRPVPAVTPSMSPVGPVATAVTLPYVSRVILSIFVPFAVEP